MSETIQVNSRGNLTLPKAFRKMLGLEKGGIMMVEASGQGIFLRPAISFPVEMYTDERVAEFDNEENDLKAYLKEKGLKK